MRVAVCSLKFSPGQFSHIVAYAKLFSDIGHDVVLFLARDYEKMNSSVDFKVLWYPESMLENCDMVLFVNPSTDNHKIAKKLKTQSSKVIYLYHEPWESFEQYTKEGFKQALKALVAHYFSVKLLKLCDLVIVPSEYAMKLYKRKDNNYNQNVIMIPLLFDDEAGNSIDFSKKIYFSYIGHAVKGHNFKVYIELIKYMYTKGINMKYEIVTRTRLNKLLSTDSSIQEMIQNGVLIVSHGRPFSNDEINKAYERSFCVWNVYRRSTQSGVLPKAYMFGTPVIASNIGSFPQFVIPGVTGEIVPLGDMSYDVFIEVLIKLKEGIETYGSKARQYFLDTFFYKQYVQKFEALLRMM